jgi:transposase
MRRQLVKIPTAPVNQVRGLLAECGIVIVQGAAHFRRALPLILEDRANGLSGVIRELLGEFGQRLKFIEERLR